MNIFTVVTPFQLFVVRKIISQYFSNDNNIIISTIKGGNDKEDTDVYQISKRLTGFAKAWRMKWLIHTHMNDVSFFVPHLGTLFASYFYELAKKYNRPINVFYEGIALYYDPVVPNIAAKKKRLLFGLLYGLIYKHHEQLFPCDFVERVSGCYAPSNTNLEKYSNVRLINLSNEGSQSGKDNILLLTSNVASEKTIDGVLSLLDNFERIDSYTLYLKPHYELDSDFIGQYIQKVRARKIGKVVLLSGKTPVEELYKDIPFKVILSQAFSSALVNAKFMLEKDVKFYIYDKQSVNKELAEMFDIVYN